MHVMEIVSGEKVNGGVRHCLLLSRELQARGHRVTVVCWPRSWTADQLRDDRLPVVTSDLHRWPWDELRRIAGVARERGVDVFHTHLSRAHSFGVLLRWMPGVPCVATAHSRHIQLHWLFNALVIAPSEATGRFHQRWNRVRKKRIAKIPCFVDPRHLAPVPDATRRRLRASFGVDDSWNLIGAIGSVIPRKGLIHLVRALPAVLHTVPRTRLVVIGDDDAAADYLALLKSTARELGLEEHILWLGNRPDVHELISALDLYVLPSLEETMPLAILEAMAGGRPVVATAGGGIPECVRDGETGLLVPPADSGFLAQAILSMLTDPARRCRLSEAARAMIRDHYAPGPLAAQVEAALAGVVRSSSPDREATSLPLPPRAHRLLAFRERRPPASPRPGNRR